MRSHVRFLLLGTLVAAICAISAPVAQAAFGVEPGNFFASNCKEATCTAATPPKELFTQAAGHPNFGITDFTFNEFGLAGNGVKTIRTDLPPGISTNPQALPLCTMAEFNANNHKNEGNHCGEETEVGEQKITVVISLKPFLTKELVGTVYNLEPATGIPLEFGIDINAEELGLAHLHSFLEGGVSWHTEPEAEEQGIASGDYHEFFKIKVPRALSEGEAPLVHSRLVFVGNEGKGLLTNPSTCIGPQTTHLWVESYLGERAHTSYTGPVGTEECNLVKFEPSFELTPSTTQSDQPDGIGVELNVPEHEKASETESADLQTTKVTLPEGLTINPAGGHGLEGCTPEQIAIGSAKPVSCPARSAIATGALEVPGLPPGSLLGNAYLGKPAAGPITGPPYTLYLDFESPRYGQSVRLRGLVMPDPSTGRLTATFTENPQAPFRSFKLKFIAGAYASLANPLACGAAKTETVLTPFTGTAAREPFSQFVVDSNGLGGGCPASPPFSWAQALSAEPAQAAGSSTVTMSLARSDGQQYLAKLRDVLPPGLTGVIPAVTQCGEAQANAGTCTSASQIGTVAVAAGAGSDPYVFNGRVYLTGPYEGAPFGLSIVVPAVAGPFNLGNVIARARIDVDPHTAQVIATDERVPTIVGGIPIRMKSLTLSINRQGFERNPTNCGAFAVESTLTSTLGATQPLASPFQAEGCSALAFTPSFAASTSAKTSKANGASLQVNISQPPGQANIRSVTTVLPKALPSRLTTLQKACLEATFAANPFSCPDGSNVGTATAVTPLLPGTMTGPAYLVSHGGAAFPDLDIVLQGSGVRIILVGNTDIKKGITTTTFAASPDAPVSSFVLNLPTGPHSALAAFGDLCVTPLAMPTTIVGQNGRQLKQNTTISVSGCGVHILRRKVSGSTAILTVKAFGAGRLSASGTSLKSVSQRVSKATTTTLKVPLASGGRHRHRPFSTRVRVAFVPSNRAEHTSSAFTTVRFG